MVNQQMNNTPGKIPPDSVSVKALIQEVTIAEDQANICRKGECNTVVGPMNLFMPDITPYLIDTTLWAELIPAEGEPPEIGSTRCIRWFITDTESKKEKEKRLLKALEQLLKQIDGLYYQGQALLALNQSLTKVFKPSLISLLENIVHKGTLPAQYETILDQILTDISQAYQSDFKIQKKAAEIQFQLTDLAKTQTADLGIIHKQAGILVTLESKTASTGILRCGYQVPCSQWRPQHEAHLEDDQNLRFMTYGVVWQNSGEDWNGVSLTLSTSKPSLGMDITIPQEDLLRLREKTKIERKAIAVEIRDQIVQTTGRSEPTEVEPPLPADGGEAQFYRVKEKVTLLSNGKPNLIELEAFCVSGETELIAIPEFDNKVYLRSRLKNIKNGPILAGPIALHRRGTFIGYGSIEFIGPKEPYFIWWGSEDMIRLERYLDHKEVEASLLHSREIETTVTLQAQNLSGETFHFQMQERIPISEVAQVVVKLKKSPEKALSPDENGFIFIPVTLGPREEAKFLLSYQLELDRDVVYQP